MPRKGLGSAVLGAPRSAMKARADGVSETAVWRISQAALT